MNARAFEPADQRDRRIIKCTCSPGDVFENSVYTGVLHSTDCAISQDDRYEVERVAREELHDELMGWPESRMPTDLVQRLDDYALRVGADRYDVIHRAVEFTVDCELFGDNHETWQLEPYVRLEGYEEKP